MYAVVKISGKQWKVETQNRIFVDKLPFKKDEIVPLDQVLLIRQENKITIGTPFVDKAIVQAKVLEQTRDKKIVVFKKKRRKGYKKKQGHRQYKTTLLIEKILVDGKALVEDTKKNKEVTATKTSNKKVLQIQNIESLKNKSSAKKFFSAAKTNILIYTKLQEEGDVVIVSYRILGKNNSSVEIATQSFSKTQFSKQIAKPETQPILLASTGNNLGGLLAQQNLEDLFEQPTQAIDDFVNKEILFAENGNSWSFYLPTAYFPARTQSLEVSFSVEDLRFAKISGEAYRYLWGNSFFEFSTNLQTRNSSLYQGFVGVKASIFQGNAVQSPFKLALGLRTLWQKSSTENESTADTSKEDERKKLRRLSFFTAISGNISDTNMLYNIYLDNYTLGGGVKLKLPYKIFLFVYGRVL